MVANFGCGGLCWRPLVPFRTIFCSCFRDKAAFFQKARLVLVTKAVHKAVDDCLRLFVPLLNGELRLLRVARLFLALRTNPFSKHLMYRCSLGDHDARSLRCRSAPVIG